MDEHTRNSHPPESAAGGRGAHVFGSKKGGNHSPGFWSIVWSRFRKDRFAMAGLLIVTAMFVVSYLAPLIANNKPIVMQWNDKLYFPAVSEMMPFRWVLNYPELFPVDFDEVKIDRSAALLMPLIQPLAMSAGSCLPPVSMTAEPRRFVGVTLPTAGPR